MTLHQTNSNDDAVVESLAQPVTVIWVPQTSAC